MMLKTADMFSGIGGFTLGLEATGGFETVVFCEKDTFCQQVLTKHWPDTPIIGDIHDVTADALRQHNIAEIDVLTAGFPCQPFSVAGKQNGTTDERFLWPELFRVIADIAPRFIILENVPHLLRIQNGLVFTGILYDLAQAGYDAEWQIIPAHIFGVPHRRERLFIIAYPNRTGAQGMHQYHSLRQAECRQQVPILGGLPTASSQPQVSLSQPYVHGGNNGVSNRTHRLRALGNSVVPQVITHIGDEILKAIQTAEMKETS